MSAANNRGDVSGTYRPGQLGAIKSYPLVESIFLQDEQGGFIVISKYMVKSKVSQRKHVTYDKGNTRCLSRADHFEPNTCSRPNLTFRIKCLFTG